MATIVNEVRPGFYLDSVALMRVSSSVASGAGVQEAAVMMGTPANLQIMSDAGILAEDGRAAKGGDLVIAVRGDDQAACDAALVAVQAALSRPRTAGSTSTWQPRSIAQAADAVDAPGLALISVPGEFAITEARKAIRNGLHAMIFSDNVPVSDERALKEEARDLGLLVMGPDCGTAIIGGLPLAFANVVPTGSIGVVGASGTGVQEITSLIAQGGGGVSHAIGVGGRDLKDEVGGITTLMALDALAADDATHSIVLVSKPPSSAVAADVLARIDAINKPVIVCFIGADTISMPTGATQVFSLEDAANVALGGAISVPVDAAGATRGNIAGLFAGGTLCAESQMLAAAAGLDVSSNVPVPGVAALRDSGHRFVDLGDDEYTQGRPHPMIDPGVRDAALAQAMADPGVSLVLMDVVLGYGSSMDPAGHLVASLSGGLTKPVVASVTGTDADPQVRSNQMRVLEQAGIKVAESNAAATRLALELA